VFLRAGRNSQDSPKTAQRRRQIAAIQRKHHTQARTAQCETKAATLSQTPPQFTSSPPNHVRKPADNLTEKPITLSRLLCRRLHHHSHPAPARTPPPSINNKKMARRILASRKMVFPWLSCHYCPLKLVASLPGLDVNHSPP
jgi:hypothetical protein